MRPGGILFEKEISIEIAYDKTKIPEGYTEKDISIFFYDRAKKLWQKLPQSEVKSHLAESVSGKTKESSDFIAGIIKLPESPDTSGFTPTRSVDSKLQALLLEYSQFLHLQQVLMAQLQPLFL